MRIANERAAIAFAQTYWPDLIIPTATLDKDSFKERAATLLAELTARNEPGDVPGIEVKPEHESCRIDFPKLK
jgi:hypothetical protein